MSARSKSKKGNYRRKRSDAKIGSIEKKYGVDFGVRSDMRLDTFLEKKGYPSLSKAVRSANEKRSKS